MTLSQQAAAEISGYLMTGMHHDTPEGRIAIAAIVARHVHAQQASQSRWEDCTRDIMRDKDQQLAAVITSMSARQIIEDVQPTPSPVAPPGLVVGYEGDSSGEMPWTEFAAINDAMGEELNDVLRDILAGKVYHGGGGAAGTFKIWRVR